MIFVSRERRFANDFSENHWQIALQVTQKYSFTVTYVSFYFLHAISFPEQTIPLKTIIDRWFRHCC